MIRKKRLESNIIGIGKNPDEKAALREALGYLPIQSLVDNTTTVTIIANLVNINPPNKGVVVGGETLRELIRYIKSKNPKRLVVAGGAGGANTLDVLKSNGYDVILNQEQVEFIDLNFGEYFDLELQHSIVKSTKINKIIKESDVLISFTQLKVHEEATMSASIKNMALSLPPAEIHGYPKKSLGIHEDLHGFIYAMAKEIPIDLAIVSLSPAMIGTGPSKGVAVHTDMLIAGLDAVAVDTICARLLGFRPQAVNYLFRLIKDGIGQANFDNIDIKGVKLIDAEKAFSKIAYGSEFSVDE
ncbi:DUF362 domain-containing protein [Caloramator proteoclasticus]|uniref:Uncharacterized conserved protein, DUF362 family n=1 Tax=Caloramator proteoclasticus DSM 10124 TaxID=1121262 RepID=A0A1M5BTE0_9CLOT|nr:DUF362 domain-containing protein [Caloramator proteoclasticus]SHF45705.1 Uncharacterized conserved protein, DUF362 family [Caloramator proteoclasticus DSM 10124]